MKTYSMDHSGKKIAMSHRTIILIIFPCCSYRSNVKSVFVQATVLALGQSLIYFLYSTGYYFGAFLVVEGRTNYDDIFRWDHFRSLTLSTNFLLILPVCLGLLCSQLLPLAKLALLLQMHPKLKSQLLRLLHFSTENLRLMHQAVRE